MGLWDPRFGSVPFSLSLSLSPLAFRIAIRKIPAKRKERADGSGQASFVSSFRAFLRTRPDQWDTIAAGSSTNKYILDDRSEIASCFTTVNGINVFFFAFLLATWSRAWSRLKPFVEGYWIIGLDNYCMYRCSLFAKVLSSLAFLSNGTFNSKLI